MNNSNNQIHSNFAATISLVERTIDQDLYFTNLLKKHTLDLASISDIKISEIIKKLEDTSISNQSKAESLKLLASICANYTLEDYEYSLLGGRILMESMYIEVGLPAISFTENLEKIENSADGRISKEVHDFVQVNKEFINQIWNGKHDFDLDYSAALSFEKRGLERIKCKLVEVPSFLFLRAAIGLNTLTERSEDEKDSIKKFYAKNNASKDDLINVNNPILKLRTLEENKANIKAYYQALIERKISLPGPILLHAGSQRNQMASCYLQYCSDTLTGDNYPITGEIGGIMKAMSQLANQSKGGGGNAIAIHDIRGDGSKIQTTNGRSNGILPFMKMFDATIGSVNQSGKRAGTCAVYLEPWHWDIMEYLDAGNHFTIEEKRCKNLFYGLFVNDLFLDRLVNDKMAAKWTLFDPKIAKEKIGTGKSLSEYYGKEFKEKYEELEKLGIGKEINLMEIWMKVINLFQTTGNPYIVNKDAMNMKSNQKNLGTIKSSNLCTEISLVSNDEETAVCVLSSICLSKFAIKNKEIENCVDYQGIIDTARLATRNLNNVIDLQYYPTLETRNSCLARRAIGVGAQGLADLFAELELAFNSLEAKSINKKVYEAIYYGCLKESMELAKEKNMTYLGFAGSPLSKGEFQFDMWGVENNDLMLKNEWSTLKNDIIKYGVLNSEVTALAPTASSSIRMGNNEMHEPFTRNLYVRQTIFGSIQIVNKFLMRDLKKINLWNKDLIGEILGNDGSIQNIPRIPKEIKQRYLTAYEMPWQELIDMMADRSPFVSQSSSFNHFTSHQDANPTSYTQKIIYAWKKGLKTLSYYMHTETASTAKKEFSSYGATNIVEPSKNQRVQCVGCDA
jgi:ribonucleoside-diphosphate reductase alpha chain